MKVCPYCAEEIREEAIKCKHCGSWLAPPPNSYAEGPEAHYGPFGHGFGPAGRLTRSTTDGMWAGVLGGLARYLRIDATWLRIGFALATFFTGIIPGLAVYIIMAIVVPTDATGKPEAF